MTSAGLLSIDATYADGRLSDVRVSLRRPPVSRLFIGQAPEAVVKTVLYLYTLCAQAQRAAAQAALTAAGAIAARPVDNAGLWIEVLNEHFWRLLLDWPSALGLAPARDAFAHWRAERLGDNNLAATRQLIDTILPELANQCRQRLNTREAADAPESHLLNAADWLVYWQGGSAHAPAIALPTSVASAFEQRLADVRRAFAGLCERRDFPVAAAGGEGWGIGQTLTARGVLTHAARVSQGKVADYRVWAPTDGHFADSTPLRKLLDGAAPTDRAMARQLVERAVLALDPCLPHIVELHHA